MVDNIIQYVLYCTLRHPLTCNINAQGWPEKFLIAKVLRNISHRTAKNDNGILNDIVTRAATNTTF